MLHRTVASTRTTDAVEGIEERVGVRGREQLDKRQRDQPQKAAAELLHRVADDEDGQGEQHEEDCGMGKVCRCSSVSISKHECHPRSWLGAYVVQPATLTIPDDPPGERIEAVGGKKEG